MRPEDYTGQEWYELMRQLDRKQLRNALKGAYRRISNMMRKRAVASLAARGPQKVLGDKSDWAKAVRARVYSRGGGFMVTVRPYRRRGFHVNRQGKEKPVLMWAEDGTKRRQTRVRGFISSRGALDRGAMPAYGFIAAVEPQLYSDAEAQLQPELERAVVRQASKAGFI